MVTRGVDQDPGPYVLCRVVYGSIAGQLITKYPTFGLRKETRENREKDGKIKRRKGRSENSTLRRLETVIEYTREKTPDI
jgi:hypothetical protein